MGFTLSHRKFRFYDEVCVVPRLENLLRGLSFTKGAQKKTRQTQVDGNLTYSQTFFPFGNIGFSSKSLRLQHSIPGLLYAQQESSSATRAPDVEKSAICCRQCILPFGRNPKKTLLENVTPCCSMLHFWNPFSLPCDILRLCRSRRRRSPPKVRAYLL